MFVRTIDEVVETLQYVKASNRKCNLLIGAGCSVTAGIETANGILEIMKKDYPSAYRNAKNKTYGDCMNELAPGQRRDLINKQVEGAKVNWAHIGLAQLLNEGYIHRVLTTNFDPLVVRACSLLKISPAIYDLAATDKFKHDYIPDKSIFYLHGQYNGFTLVNTEEECSRQFERLEPVFRDLNQDSVWIVVGYSGENDAIFKFLANQQYFDYKLFWVGYQQNEPPKHVQEHLLHGGKYAYYIKGYDADKFFVDLARKLECFPPEFVVKPFTYLSSVIEGITPFKIDDKYTEITEQTQSIIEKAIHEYEHDKYFMGSKYLMAGLNSQVMALEYDFDQEPQIGNLVSLAYIKEGSEYYNKAIEETDPSMLEMAIDLFHHSSRHCPDAYQPYYNLGISYSRLGSMLKKVGGSYGKFETACNYLREAYGKCSNEPCILNAWGVALLCLANARSNLADQTSLLNEAEDLLLRAESLSPGYGAYNLACTYSLLKDFIRCKEWLERYVQGGGC